MATIDDSRSLRTPGAPTERDLLLELVNGQHLILELLGRYQPLIDAAEARLTKPKRFGGPRGN